MQKCKNKFVEKLKIEIENREFKARHLRMIYTYKQIILFLINIFNWKINQKDMDKLFLWYPTIVYTYIVSIGCSCLE